MCYYISGANECVKSPIEEDSCVDHDLLQQHGLSRKLSLKKRAPITTTLNETAEDIRTIEMKLEAVNSLDDVIMDSDDDEVVEQVHQLKLPQSTWLTAGEVS